MEAESCWSRDGLTLTRSTSAIRTFATEKTIAAARRRGITTKDHLFDGRHERKLLHRFGHKFYSQVRALDLASCSTSLWH